MYRTFLGVKGVGAKTAVSLTFSCNGKKTKTFGRGGGRKKTHGVLNK